MRDIGGWRDHHLVDRDTLRAGLVGGHPSAQHVGGVLDRVVRGGRKLHAASFASTTRMNLRFDDDRAAEFVGCGFRIVSRFHDAPRQYGDAVVFEELLGLVLVEVHSVRFGFGSRRLIDSR